jgi:hypothetical protein
VTLAGRKSIDPLPFGGIRITAGDCRSKAAFVDINKLFPPPLIAVTSAQIGLSLLLVALFVP